MTLKNTTHVPYKASVEVDTKGIRAFPPLIDKLPELGNAPSGFNKEELQRGAQSTQFSFSGFFFFLLIVYLYKTHDILHHLSFNFTSFICAIKQMTNKWPLFTIMVWTWTVCYSVSYGDHLIIGRTYGRPQALKAHKQDARWNRNLILFYVLSLGQTLRLLFCSLQGWRALTAASSDVPSWAEVTMDPSKVDRSPPEFHPKCITVVCIISPVLTVVP